MQTTIIDGRKIKNEILNEVRKGIQSLSFVPVFCDILVGDDKVSAQYVQMKAKTAESVGIKFYLANFPESITTEELISEINNIDRISNLCGVIVQLPLPAHINKKSVLDAIRPELDVDCLGTSASEIFYKNQNQVGPPTALACMEMIDHTGISLYDKNITVVGQGDLVGKPVVHLLKSRGLSVSTIDGQTKNSTELIKNSDIIISGAGQGKLITGDKIKKGVVIIDAGTSEDNGSVVGDVDLETVESIASFISPTPGGVGPVTVAMLLRNVLKVAQMI